MDETYNDVKWQEFEKTGTVAAYLKYKGIYISKENNNDIVPHTDIRDGEPIGYY